MVDHGKSTKRKKFHDKDKYYKRKYRTKKNLRANGKNSCIALKFKVQNSTTIISFAEILTFLVACFALLC